MNRIIAENEAVGYYKTSRSGKAHKIRAFPKKEIQSDEKT